MTSSRRYDVNFTSLRQQVIASGTSDLTGLFIFRVAMRKTKVFDSKKKQF